RLRYSPRRNAHLGNYHALTTILAGDLVATGASPTQRCPPTPPNWRLKMYDAAYLITIMGIKAQLHTQCARYIFFMQAVQAIKAVIQGKQGLALLLILQ